MFSKIRKIHQRTAFQVVVIFLAVSIIYFSARKFLENIPFLVKIIREGGIIGPIVLIVFMSLGVLFTPIPGFVWIMTSGYIYGLLWGSIYSYIALNLASVGTFELARRIKTKRKIRGYEKYKEIMNKNKNILYFLYIIPVLPVSVISVVAASSRISGREFLKITLISFIPLVLFFSFFGNRLSHQNIVEIIVLAFIVVIMFYILFKKFNPLKKKFWIKK